MKRGDVFLASLDPVRGSEQAGARPVVITQADLLTEFLRTVVVIPLLPISGGHDFPSVLPFHVAKADLLPIPSRYATNSESWTSRG